MKLKYSECIEDKTFVMKEADYDRIEGRWPWKMKCYSREVEGAKMEYDEPHHYGVELTALYKGGVEFVGHTAKTRTASNVLRDCFSVAVTIGDTTRTNYYSDEAEAIDYTLKVIALAKA